MCNGDGHSEALLIAYDPEQVTYDELLAHFWNRAKDNTLDTPQYRSTIWFHNEQQRKTAELFLRAQNADDIRILPVAQWFDAEDYHQNYVTQTTFQGFGNYEVDWGCNQQ